MDGVAGSEEGVHRRALGDRLLGELLAPPPALLEEALKDHQQGRHFHRLGEEVGGPLLQGFDGQVDGTMPGEDNHQDVRIDVLELGQQVEGVSVSDYAINMDKFEAVKFKPRGWAWIDPTKEVAAFKEAIKAGLTTRTQVISSTAEGRDVEDIDEERDQELENAAQLGLSFDTDPGAGENEAPTDDKTPDDSDDDDNAKTDKPLRAVR